MLTLSIILFNLMMVFIGSHWLLLIPMKLWSSGPSIWKELWNHGGGLPHHDSGLSCLQTDCVISCSRVRILWQFNREIAFVGAGRSHGSINQTLTPPSIPIRLASRACPIREIWTADGLPDLNSWWSFVRNWIRTNQLSREPLDAGHGHCRSQQDRRNLYV